MHLIWKVDAILVDLSDYTADMQIRPRVDSSTVHLTLSEAAGITLTASGEITIGITDTQTSALPIGQSVYDLELTNDYGDVRRLIQGKIEVDGEVTR